MITVSTEKLLKRSYVGASRVARSALQPIAPTAAAQEPGTGRYRRWLRSLLAIYDIDEMNRLDLAWWQFDALAEVGRFLSSKVQPRVFEYGSGASTLWLARRAAAVVSIEHDEDWYGQLETRLAAYSNVRLRLVPASRAGVSADTYLSQKPGSENVSFCSYVHAIEDESGQFDLIVIDGRCRTRCLEVAKSRLAEGGMIVFDNSNRSRYRSAINAASEFQRARFRGLTPCLPYPDETTLLKHLP